MINVDKLFDFIKVIFSNNNDFENLTISDKTKHTYMLQRFLAIKYPLQANLFNMNKTNPLGVAESWRIVTKRFGKTPPWIYTKTKRAVEKKSDSYVPSEEAVLEYMMINEIGKREFDDAMKFKPDELKTDLKVLETLFVGYSKEKNKKK